MKDALNEDVILDKVYGYSQSVNGFTTIVIGKVIKILSKSVTLQVITKKRSLWGDELKEEETQENSKVNIKTPILFPVSGYEWWHTLKVGDIVRPTEKCLTTLASPPIDKKYEVVAIDRDLIYIDNGVHNRYHHSWYKKVNKK
jgi:hypothetical protein